MLRWTVCPDAAMLEAAETDVRRALILQNSRVATRLDPVSKVRTHRNEERVRRVGLVVSGAGAMLATTLVIGTYVARGEVRVLHLGLLLVFLVLVPLFLVLPRLRQAGVRRLDALLARRAKKVMAAWTVGVERRYELEGAALRSDVGGNVIERSLSGLCYGLIGDRTLLLYTSRNAQTAKLVVLVGEEGERVAEALDIEIERLARDLMPATTVERSW